MEPALQQSCTFDKYSVYIFGEHHIYILMSDVQGIYMYFQILLHGPSSPYEMSFYSMTNVGRYT